MAEDRLSVIFAALADPTRRAILARLAEGDATVSELAEPFAISLPAISRHLKVLEHAGLITPVVADVTDADAPARVVGA
ncbi:ArsR/SmtB family transcription factor, partial [Micromonospora chersina]